MLDILKLTFPFFALVLAGYVAARRRMLPLDAIPGLNTFVLFFALPCMLFRFGASTPTAQLLDGAAAGTWVACMLLVVGGTIHFSRNPRIGWNDASFGALVAAFPNTGFMGVPLLAALLGPRSAGPAMLSIMIDMVVTTSLCIALSRLDASGGQGAGAALGKALRGAAANPLGWAILLGAAVSAAGLQLWSPVARTVGLLADAASPVALFTIGAVLWRSQSLAAGREHAPMPWRDFLPVAGVKLLLHPLLVWGAGRGAIALGLPLSGSALQVLVLVAALPSASNVAMLTERYGADTGRVARIILVTTAAAFLSFSAAVALLA